MKTLKYMFILAAILNSQVKAAEVDFTVELTAKGDEVISYENREYTGVFPYFDIRGGTFGGWPRRTETVTYCLPVEVMQECTIDTSRTHSTHTPEGPLYGQGGPGFGIFINTVNSPGGAQNASYTLNMNNGCLTSEVTVRAKRRARGWYQGSHKIYVRCPVIEPWEQTQTKGPYTIDSADGYNLITQYDGPIGSGNGIAGTASVYTDGTGYAAEILTTDPVNADITHGMFSSTPANGVNGKRFYATFAGNDIFTQGLEISQGMQNLYNDMPLVSYRRTMARFYVQSTLPVSTVSAELRAFRNGVELSNSPITSERVITVKDTGIDRLNLDDAFLFKLPNQWTLGGNIQFRAKVNPSFTLTDSNVNNNEWIEHVFFNDASIDTVVETPLHLHDGADRDNPLRVYESSHPHYAPIMGHVVRHQPVAQVASFNCGFKALKPFWHFWPFHKEWNLTNDNHWSNILSRMQWKRFWSSCGYSSSFWSGMIHPNLPEAELSSILGIARSSRSVQASIMSGITTYTDWYNSRGGATVSHEIGHLKDLQHVCDANSPANLDNNYPYPNTCDFSLGFSTFFSNGHDGYYGLDVYHDYFGIQNPTVISNFNAGGSVPSFQHARPVMSYINAKRWISPYSYCRLLSKKGITCNANLIASRYMPKFILDQLAYLPAPTPEQGDAALRRAATPGKNVTAEVDISALNIDNGGPVDLDKALATDFNSILISGMLDISTQTVDDLIMMKTSPGIRPINAAYQESAAAVDKLRSKTPKQLNELLALSVTQYGRNLVLSRYLIPVEHNDDAVGQTTFSFMQLVPLTARADRIELSFNLDVIASVDLSGSAPELELAFVETQINNETTLAWQANDADGDELIFSVFYSHDDGVSWILVEDQITNDFYRLDSDSSYVDPLTHYRGSRVGRFKVVAFDGFNSSSQVTDALMVPGSKPQVTILQQDGQQISAGETVYLTATVSDIEDGPMGIGALSTTNGSNMLRPVGDPLPPLIRPRVTWTSGLDGVLGSGLEIQTRGLSVGVHLITAEVTDSDGMVGFANIKLTVNPIR